MLNFPKPIKKLGQHFLLNNSLLDFAAESGEISKKDVILEIGAGTGNLTEKLLKKARKVIAVEPDKRLISILEQKFAKEIIQNKLELIPKKFEKINFESLKFNKCISNIPYKLSSEVIEFICKNRIFSLILLQKEFAERLIAESGSKDYSRITILCQFYTIPVFLREIKKKKFYPPPKVDSALIKFFPKKKVPEIDEEKFFFFVSCLFSHSKNTVRKALKSEKKKLNIEKDKIEKLPFLDRRVRELEINEIIKLFKKYEVI